MSEKKKVGIVVDKHKVKHFEDTLTRHKYEFETKPGVTEDTKLITVPVWPENMYIFSKLVKKMNVETQNPN